MAGRGQEPRLTVTGVGAITSVGLHAAAAWAAIRAGLSRPRAVSWFQVLQPDTQDLIPLTAHALEGYTDGFFGQARLLRLAEGCVQDLLLSPEVPPVEDHGFWSGTGLMFVTPPDEEEDGLDEEPNEELEELFRDDCCLPLLEALALPIEPSQVRVLTRGPAGTAEALAQVLSPRGRGHGPDRWLIVAADTWLDPELLEGLADQNRLKHEDNPVGMIPGEAAACLLVETPDGARRRGARTLAGITASAIGAEPNHRFSGKPNQGRGMAGCIRSALGTQAGGDPFAGDLYLDLNGEVWRAQEWGNARARLGTALGPVDVHLPSISVGDVGAASGALGIALATQGFTHRPAGPRQALVVSSARWGGVGCVALTAAEAA